MATAVTMPDEDELLTAQQVHDLNLLPYHPRTLMDFARTGRIGHTKLSQRKIRFTRRHIAEFKEAGDKSPTPAAVKPARDPKYATTSK